mgnify:CR=1 FL=1
MIVSASNMISLAEKSGAGVVEITGGEPLTQPRVPELCQNLIDKNFCVLLETNGSISIKDVPNKVVVILDCKCPSSGESKSFFTDNFNLIKSKDELKFVIADKRDFRCAEKMIEKYSVLEKTNKIFFSTVCGVLSPAILADWMLKSKSKAILGIQLHKIIWGNDSGGR